MPVGAFATWRISSTESSARPADPAAAHPARAALLLGALGVVFGDIGTSPIYAFREPLKAAGSAAAAETVLGILSLVFWRRYFFSVPSSRGLMPKCTAAKPLKAKQMSAVNSPPLARATEPSPASARQS
jgi:K+ potassium transporter